MALETLKIHKESILWQFDCRWYSEIGLTGFFLDKP